jgi:hypothetical protein
VDRALWLLLWLKFRGWLRRLGRNARTVKGVVLLVIGVFFFGCVLLNPIIAYFFGMADSDRAESLDRTRHFSALGLFSYCALTVLFASGERAVAFTPAEVNLLFTAPFSRRQLLGYKIVASFLACLITSLFMTVFLLSRGAWPVAAYIGLVLTFEFLSLFGMAISLLINTIGARAYNLPRRLVLVGLLAVGLLVLLSLGRDLFQLGSAELLERIDQSTVFQVVLAPFNWFVHTFTALSWRDLLANGALGLAVDLALVVVVFALDAQYLEASASASERIYARLQRIRSGGAFAAYRSSGGKARFSLPSLPRWGGAGAIAWRQLTTAVRSLRGLLFFLIFFAVIVAAVPVGLSFGGEETRHPDVGRGIAIALLAMTFLSLPSMLAFDFRDDIDRMDVLKSLPIAPAWLVVGQLLAPVLLLSVIQLGMMTVIQIIWGGVAEVLLGTVFLCWPVNFLSLGIDNLLFLWFPTRQAVAMPGDFQLMGRQMLVTLAKTLILLIAGGIALLFGIIVYLFLTDKNLVAAMLTALVVLLPFVAALVPLLVLAFRHFDVARDTPA